MVTVPFAASSGHIVVTGPNGRSRPFGPIHVVRLVSGGGGVGLPAFSGAGPTAFDGTGMWIWYLNRSDAGDLSQIVARAHRLRISTLFIKSSDGSSNYWSQFSSSLVRSLKAQGLNVCAWQYVYGTHPTGEAALGARAVAAGADCLVIDAESEYEGRYAAAQTYIRTLRAAIGASFPVGLASFPYVDYHPALPFSVFLGPGGAQANLPQMYCKEIGTSVDHCFAHTFDHNSIYRRPIFPLGQSYNDPAPADILRFRELSVGYGSTGLSFWDWQETTSRGWAAIGSPLAPLTNFTPRVTLPQLHRGSKGDEVVWLQQHLATAEPGIPIDGLFGSSTERALSAFQQGHAIPASGVSDSATWNAILAIAPTAVNWGAVARAAVAARDTAHGPRSARLRGREEIGPRRG